MTVLDVRPVGYALAARTVGGEIAGDTVMIAENLGYDLAGCYGMAGTDDVGVAMGRVLRRGRGGCAVGDARRGERDVLRRGAAGADRHQLRRCRGRVHPVGDGGAVCGAVGVVERARAGTAAVGGRGPGCPNRPAGRCCSTRSGGSGRTDIKICCATRRRPGGRRRTPSRRSHPTSTARSTRSRRSARPRSMTRSRSCGLRRAGSSRSVGRYRELAAACEDYAHRLDEAHSAILHECVEFIDITVAAEAAGGLLSVVTVGLSEVAANSAVVAAAYRIGRTIADLIDALAAAVVPMAAELDAAAAGFATVERELAPILARRVEQAEVVRPGVAARSRRPSVGSPTDVADRGWSRVGGRRCSRTSRIRDYSTRSR